MPVTPAGSARRSATASYLADTVCRIVETGVVDIPRARGAGEARYSRGRGRLLRHFRSKSTTDHSATPRRYLVPHPNRYAPLDPQARTLRPFPSSYGCWETEGASHVSQAVARRNSPDYH